MSDRSFDSFDPDHALPCGRTAGMLLDFLADSAPAELSKHILDCPHCQSKLAELDADWAPARHAATTPIDPSGGG